jgi:hypothetical protein
MKTFKEYLEEKRSKETPIEEKLVEEASESEIVKIARKQMIIHKDLLEKLKYALV